MAVEQPGSEFLRHDAVRSLLGSFHRRVNRELIWSNSEKCSHPFEVRNPVGNPWLAGITNHGATNAHTKHFRGRNPDLAGNAGRSSDRARAARTTWL